MNSKIIKISEINQSIVIPIYQRLYEWDKEQIRTLLDDILNANEEYFIGTITTSLRNNELIIIDGQQRLSTIFFLCAYMCYENNKMQKAEGEFANAFNFAYLENECRFKMPLREDITDAIWDYDFNNLGENIDNAFNTFEEYFKYNDMSKLNENLFENIKINLVILDDNLGEYFLTMNSNLIQLNPSDILKSYLLNLLKDDDKYFYYSNILNECMQMDKIADFNTEYKALSIDDILNTKNHENNIKIYESLIDYPTFVLHIFRILFGDEIKIDKTKFLENTWNKIEQTKENAIKIINALKEYRIIFDRRSVRKTHEDYKLLGDLKDAKLELFLNYLRVARNPSEYLETLLTCKSDEDLFKELKNLDDNLAKNDNLDDLNYNHQNIVYWLQRYEYYLMQDVDFKNNYKNYIANYRFRDINSVEHIYPQSKSKIDDLGNLAVISDSENSQFSDKDFNKKKNIFQNFINEKIIISLKLLEVYSKNSWDLEEINAYHKKMLDILNNSF
ncbi:DUF262 domain-containing protein [Campylobacter sp. RM12651]|uniref:DUF262 domain-containing protein n=1 Tax=Campylobacter sp. RM12651 TaxID=1660079 RepID=UPI001EFA47B3|nr:DUF262 domain-containing protein [Campylobacter sp. RM12651]ULO03629.1 DUF262 and DUF1524 domain-containing protein [Campylobacter sp. RM12651]